MNNLNVKESQQQVATHKDREIWISNELTNYGIESIMPCTRTRARFTEACATAMMNNPNLNQVSRASLLGALIQCAKRDLMPDNREAALVPYKSSITLIPMIDGILKIAHKSGQIKNIFAKPIYSNEYFERFVDEHGDHIMHKPLLSNRGELVGVYAVAKSTNDSIYVEVMNIDDVEQVKRASKSSQSGPWVAWYERMAIKSVLHRLCKRLPCWSSDMLESESGQDDAVVSNDNVVHISKKNIDINDEF